MLHDAGGYGYELKRWDARAAWKGGQATRGYCDPGNNSGCPKQDRGDLFTALRHGWCGKNHDCPRDRARSSMARPMAVRMTPSEVGDWRAGSVTEATGFPSRMIVTVPASTVRGLTRVPWCTSCVLTTRVDLCCFTGAIMREGGLQANPSRRKISKTGNYRRGVNGMRRRRRRSGEESEKWKFSGFWAVSFLPGLLRLSPRPYLL